MPKQLSSRCLHRLERRKMAELGGPWTTALCGAHAVALFMVYYYFCKLHKAHRLTRAMAAGVTDWLWEVADIVKVLEDWEAGQ